MQASQDMNCVCMHEDLWERLYENRFASQSLIPEGQQMSFQSMFRQRHRAELNPSDRVDMGLGGVHWPTSGHTFTFFLSVKDGNEDGPLGETFFEGSTTITLRRKTEKAHIRISNARQATLLTEAGHDDHDEPVREHATATLSVLRHCDGACIWKDRWMDGSRDDCCGEPIGSFGCLVETDLFEMDSFYTDDHTIFLEQGCEWRGHGCNVCYYATFEVGFDIENFAYSSQTPQAAVISPSKMRWVKNEGGCGPEEMGEYSEMRLVELLMSGKLRWQTP